MKRSTSPERAAGRGNGRSTLENSLIVALFSGLHIALRYVVQLAIAAKFGAGQEMDTYLAALALPETISLALLSGVSVTLVPILIEYDKKSGEEEFWHIASSFLNLTAIALFSIALLGVSSAPLLVRLTAPGFKGETLATAVMLARMLFLTTALSGLVGVLSNIFYARRSFFWPSLIPLLGTAANLALILSTASRVGIEIVALGLGLSAILQLMILSAIILRGRYHPILDLGHAGIRRILALMTPLLGAAFLYRSNIVVDRLVGSMLPAGSVSYLGYAFKILTTANTLTTKGIALVLLPVMSVLAAERDYEGLGNLTARAFSAGLFLAVPTFTFLTFFSQETIALLFQRGQFDEAATMGTAQALVFYTGAGILTGVNSILTYCLYSLQRQATAAKLAVAGTTLNMILNFALANLFGFKGIALAGSIAIPFNTVLLLMIIRKNLPSFSARRAAVKFLQFLALSCSIWSIVRVLGDMYGERPGILAQALALSASFAIGLGLYAAWTFLLKMPEALYIRKQLSERVRSYFLVGGISG